jgi:hypothetical protein
MGRGEEEGEGKDRKNQDIPLEARNLEISKNSETQSCSLFYLCWGFYCTMAIITPKRSNSYNCE